MSHSPTITGWGDGHKAEGRKTIQWVTNHCRLVIKQRLWSPWMWQPAVSYALHLCVARCMKKRHGARHSLGTRLTGCLHHVIQKAVASILLLPWQIQWCPMWWWIHTLDSEHKLCLPAAVKVSLVRYYFSPDRYSGVPCGDGFTLWQWA